MNLPLIPDRLAVRVSGRYKDRDGFIDNLLGGDDLNSVNVGTGRVALRWTPDDRLTVDLLAN